MIKNYLKVALRSLSKNKVFTLINVLGLSFGMACFIFMSLWIWDELSYDQFHQKGDRIRQVYAERSVSGDSHIVPYMPSSLVSHVEEQVPEIKNITRVFPAEVVFQHESISFSEKGVYTDPSFLNIFNFPLQEGNVATAFAGANSVVITADLAAKYFPEQSALGKYIDIVQKEKKQYVITGVLEDIPANSSLQFDFIMSYEQFENDFRPWWKGSNDASFSNFNVTAYLETQSGTDVHEINGKLTDVLNNYSTVENDALFVYPFKDIYLHSDFSEGRQPTGRIKYVNIMSVIALAVLLIACINFINLSSVMAGKRKLEAGLRKVVGASKRQIILQFITESVLISLASVVLAITAVEVLLPAFNLLTDKLITVPFSSVSFLSLLLSGGTIIGVLAGAYPAFYFSSFEIFNTESKRSAGGLSLIKKALVVLQFSCSIIFIVFTTVLFQQVDYINSKELGIRTKNIISHPLRGIKGHQEAYKNELLSIPGIQSVGFTEQDPIGTSNKNNGVWWQGKPENSPVYFNVMQASQDFTETFEIQLLEGKPFSLDLNQDEVQFIINESAAKQIMSEDIIGLPLTVWGNEGKIVGIVKDYHHQSLMHHIEPLVVICNPKETWNAYISLAGENKTALLEKIGQVYAKYEQAYPFDFSFVEDRYQSKYGAVNNAGKLSATFSVAAILISCLGLFGLSAFVMQQKSKETGIRKVMGAGTFNLVYLFSTSFIKLVLVALILAIPIAWIYTEQWLSGFAYHTLLDYKPFLLAAIIAIIIALITVVYNTLKASLANPVDTLKEE